MEDMLPMQGTPRLIDAHPFVWVIKVSFPDQVAAEVLF